jgi:hypothetical protein
MTETKYLICLSNATFDKYIINKTTRSPQEELEDMNHRGLEFNPEPYRIECAVVSSEEKINSALNLLSKYRDKLTFYLVPLAMIKHIFEATEIIPEPVSSPAEPSHESRRQKRKQKTKDKKMSNYLVDNELVYPTNKITPEWNGVHDTESNKIIRNGSSYSPSRFTEEYLKSNGNPNPSRDGWLECSVVRRGKLVTLDHLRSNLPH